MSSLGYVKCVPNATLVSLPGLDRITGVHRADLVLPHGRQFLAETSRV
jgi:hypothetical protein